LGRDSHRSNRIKKKGKKQPPGGGARFSVRLSIRSYQGKKETDQASVQVRVTYSSKKVGEGKVKTALSKNFTSEGQPFSPQGRRGEKFSYGKMCR